MRISCMNRMHFSWNHKCLQQQTNHFHFFNFSVFNDSLDLDFPRCNQRIIEMTVFSSKKKMIDIVWLHYCKHFRSYYNEIALFCWFSTNIFMKSSKDFKEKMAFNGQIMRTSQLFKIIVQKKLRKWLRKRQIL